MRTLKEMVTNNQQVKFQFYRQGELWYATNCGFVFPVPIADTGDGVFLATDKAILFMRYIRKYMNAIEQERKSYVDHQSS